MTDDRDDTFDDGYRPSRQDEKLQRWTDLLAALLPRTQPVPFERLREEVPGYRYHEDDFPDPAERRRRQQAVRRMFERDKDELRAFGIPIRTEGGDDEEPAGYLLTTKHFYLPYLAVRRGAEVTAPPVVSRFGLKGLPRIEVTPDQLQAVVEAAARLARLDHPALAEHARTAVRKLAFDLPIDASLPPGPVQVARGPERLRPATAVLDALDAALVGKKRATFIYRSMHSDTEGERTVEPYGLFYLNGHWYLAAVEAGDTTVKNFRVNRIRDVRVNGTKPGTPDYAVPATFRLREHARSRHAWELGDTEAIAVTVEFRTEAGVAAAAADLGAPVPDAPRRRAFAVRRPDAFVRWLLSLGGTAAPVAPPEVVEAYRAQVAETLALYAGASA